MQSDGHDTRTRVHMAPVRVSGTCRHLVYTRAYVNRRGPRRKGVNMDVILSSLSLMAASLLALVRGIAISIIIVQAVIAAVLCRIPSFRRLLSMASCFMLPLGSKSL